MKPIHPALKKILFLWSIFSWIVITAFGGIVLFSVLLSPFNGILDKQPYQSIRFAWLVSGFFIGIWYVVRKFRKEETPYQLAVWIPFGLAFLGLLGAVIAGLIVRFTF